MVRKILRVVLTLFGVSIIAVVLHTCYLGIKLQQKEPEFQQYVTMTTEDQNAYALKFFNEFYGDTMPVKNKDTDDIDKATKEFESNPEALQAKIKLARSLVARFTLKVGSICENLSPEVLEQLQTEHGEYRARLEEYHKFIRAYVQDEK